jgi:multiple sugar transport system substrate-binding protein
MKGKLKKIVTILMVASLVLSLFSGFTSSKATKTSDGVVNITHWVWLDNPKDPTFKNLVSQFNKSHPKIHVNLEIIPYADFSTKLLTASTADGLPDTSSFKLTWVPTFVANDTLEPLDGYLNKWKGLSEIDPSLLKVMKVTDDKKTYVMPWVVQVLYMYYRPSLFKAAGITSIPKTWDEWLKDAQKLTIVKNGQTVQYGFGMRGAFGGQEPWGSFVFANIDGNKIMDNGKAVFNTVDGNKGNDLFLDLFRKYKVVPPTAPNDGLPQLKANFIAGKTAMMVHHIMSSNELVKALGSDVAAMPMPEGTKGRWTSLGDTENVVYKSSKNKEAAFTFVSWLSERQQDDIWCRASGNVPVNKLVQKFSYYQNNKFMRTSFDSLSFAHIFPAVTSMVNWLNIWPATTQQALTGQITGKKMMDTLEEEMNKK